MTLFQLYRDVKIFGRKRSLNRGVFLDRSSMVSANSLTMDRVGFSLSAVHCATLRFGALGISKMYLWLKYS